MSKQVRRPNGQFQKNTHWRLPNPLWDKEWLTEAYITKKRSMRDIANEQKVSEPAVRHWIRKHNIKSRNVSEARKVKHWGQQGESNPMWGKTGKDNPNWKGGNTPDRQLLYASSKWKKSVRDVWTRDNYTCQKCKIKKTKNTQFEIHHIIPYATGVKISDPANLVLLCETCHKFIHSKNNVESLFLYDISEINDSLPST